MRGRYVQGNLTSRAPAAHIVIDTETNTAEGDTPGLAHHTIRLACAISWRREAGRIRARRTMRCTTGADLWSWVRSRLSRHRPTYLWAHNLPFDLTISDFWHYWERGDYADKFHALGGENCILVGHFPEGKIVLLDTHSWFKTTLKILGDWVGIPKKEVDFGDVSDDILADYCLNDCKIVEAVVNRICDLVTTLDMGVMRYTAASQAHRHWRHMEDRPSVCIPGKPRESRLARASFYGGRTECFYIGQMKGPIYALDVNGMYGHCMLSPQLPCRLIAYTERATLDDLMRHLSEPRVSATVRLQTDTTYPIRVPHVGTLYAVGDYWTHLCGIELQKALNDGVVRDVSRMSLYELAPVCRSFSEYWYAKRLEYRANGDAIMERLAKDMPCHLFGKFGQRSPAWTAMDDVSAIQLWGEHRYYDCAAKCMRPGRVIAGVLEIDESRIYRQRSDADGTYLVEDNDPELVRETGDSFPAISGWITAIGRQSMDRYRAIAGERNVYYQCGDCIHVSEEGYRNLCNGYCVHATEQGALKRSAVYMDAEYIGINVLRLDGEWKIAGLPRKHVVDADGTITATHWERIDSILRRGPDGSVQVWEDRFVPRLDYDHGVVTDTGWCRPVRITPEDSPAGP